MEQININGENTELENLENIINTNILTPNIEDIIEVTYAYKNFKGGTNWNTTLFNKLINEDSKNIEDNIINSKKNGNIKYNKNILLKRKSKKISKTLKSKISEIETILKDLKKINTNNHKKDLLISTLEYAKNNLEIAFIGLPFELEKAGVPLKLNKNEIKKRIEKIENLEKINFGGKYSENPEEMQIIYNFMKSNYDENNENLNSDEKREYNFFLKTIKEKIGENFTYSEPEKSEEIHPAMKLKMHRDEYKKIFEAIPKLISYEKEVEISNEYGSFYDGTKWFIPGNDDYKNKSLDYIFPTAVHEGFHLTTEKLGKENVQGVKGGGFLEKEEGMAVYLEYLLKGEKNLVGLGEPRLLIGELFNGKNTEKFIKLHNKLNPRRASGNILRNKRNYPLHYKGVQHKDASYGRGLRQIKKIMDGDIKNISKKSLFIGKMNFDFLEKHGDKYTANLPNEVLYPFIMAEMMKFYAINYYDNKKNQITYKFDGKKFNEYIKEKYSNLGLEGLEIINNEFFIKRTSEKQRIGSIVNPIKKSIQNIIDNNFKKAA